MRQHQQVHMKLLLYCIYFESDKEFAEFTLHESVRTHLEGYVNECHTMCQHFKVLNQSGLGEAP